MDIDFGKRRKLNPATFSNLSDGAAMPCGKMYGPGINFTSQGHMSDTYAERINPASTRLEKPVSPVRAGRSIGSAPSSNMFKLQVDELLVNLRRNHEREVIGIESILSEVKDIIERIPPLEGLPVRFTLAQLS